MAVSTAISGTPVPFPCSGVKGKLIVGDAIRVSVALRVTSMAGVAVGKGEGSLSHEATNKPNPTKRHTTLVILPGNKTLIVRAPLCDISFCAYYTSYTIARISDAQGYLRLLANNSNLSQVQPCKLCYNEWRERRNQIAHPNILLRKAAMLHRLKDRVGKSNMSSSPGKACGHAGHWRCVYADPRSGGLLQAIERLVAGSAPAFTQGSLSLYIAPDENIRMCAWATRRRVLTAYPEVQGGPLWPLKLVATTPWQGGIEGHLTGECMGAEVRFFDTRFYVNKGKYRLGETYNFRMGALAYKLGPSQSWEVEIEGGANVSFAGACAYMPAGDGADLDDYWFHSPLEGEVSSATLNDVALRGYPVTLALPSDFEMSLTLFAAPHTEDPNVQRIVPGEDLQGYLWLQGYLD